ncbi:hydrogenase expression protein HypA [Photobacterium swingsii]|uniref:hydrogenase expression protein HypA n=1 Tax=Photobacterium swingsii TaxID=680026 RepID=UPI00352E96D5
MRAFIRIMAVAMLGGILTACGGGGSDDPAVVPQEVVEISSRFTVTVDVPEGLATAYQSTLPQPKSPLSLSIINTAHADILSSLQEKNFKIVLIDGQGKIYRTSTLSGWQKLSNGGYQFDADTSLRVNAVLLVDIFNEPEVIIGDPLPKHLYMVPLTSSEVVVSLNSTLAYQAIAKRVVEKGDWGVFLETAVDPNVRKLREATAYMTQINSEIESALRPQLGTLGMTLQNILILTKVRDITDGIIDRTYSEQLGAEGNIEAILTDGYWRLNSFDSNQGSGINANQYAYDGTETRQTDTGWRKDGSTDINFSTYFTYFSESTRFSSNDISKQVFTGGGWQGLFDYDKVVLTTKKTALMTNSALQGNEELGNNLSVKVYPLTGKKIRYFLSSKDNHHISKYIPADTEFTEDTYGFYFTWQPQKEQYLLCDTRDNNDACRVSSPAQPSVHITALEDVISDVHASQVLETKGFSLSDKFVVEFVQDEGFYTAYYWFNVAGDNWDVFTEGTFAPVTLGNTEFIQFVVPDIVKQLDDSYRFTTNNLFLVEDRNFVNIGETLLKFEPFHFAGFDNNAKAQIFAAASRSNLPPFGRCTFGDTSTATTDKFLNAIIECGGDERFTAEDISGLINQHLVQLTESGDIDTVILKPDNTWEYYINGDRQFNDRTWTHTSEGYLKINWDPAQEQDFDLMAVTSRDRNTNLYAYKVFFSRFDPFGPVVNSIFSSINKEYSPFELTACITGDSGWDMTTIAPLSKSTKAQYQNETAACMVGWDNKMVRFNEAMLIGETGIASDDKALKFASDSSRFLKLSDEFDGDFFRGKYIDSAGCGFNIDIHWKVDEDGSLFYQAVDGSLNERITLTESDGLRFTIKAFNHQTRWQAGLQFAADEGEVWSDIITFISANDVPNVTTIQPPVVPEGQPQPRPPGIANGTILDDGRACEYITP